MAKITLNDVTNGYSGPARINANNDLIEAALENTLSRDGTSPNQMEADLDLNGNQIINLGSPTSPTDAARLVDITGLITLEGMPIPAVTGNDGKLLSTDGVDLFWVDIDPDALPLFTSTDRGAVPNSPSMLDTVILWGDGAWATPASRDIAMVDTANTFEGAQRVVFETVTFGATSTVDTSLSNHYKLTLTGPTTIALTNAADGANLHLYLIQDGTGGHVAAWPSITWTNGAPPVLNTAADAANVVNLRYDGTTWFGDYNATEGDPSDDPSDYDLALLVNEENVDLFRRLGSPITTQNWTVLIGDGVVIGSRTRAVQALKTSGAFPSGTTISIVNRGYIIAKGGEGGSAAQLTAETGVVWAVAYGQPEAGGDAIEGPATGVTVSINNVAGRVWGGGGGGGAGGASADNGIAIGGPGGGGAGNGRGGRGGYAKASGDVLTASVDNAGDGVLGLDGSDAGGAGAAGDGDSSGGHDAGTGGDGGDYGAAGSNGEAAVDQSNLIIAPGVGGAAGRAVTAGYAGTLTFTSGASSPNVKGAV